MCWWGTFASAWRSRSIGPPDLASEPASDRPLRAQTANERYFLDYAMRQRERRGAPIRVLDFGCGLGEKVRLLRQAGIDCVGAEVFYGGTAWDDAALFELLDSGLIRRVGADGRLPFEEDSFDLIISDEVIEHVEDLAGVAVELERVLRPGGVMYHQFPTREILREVHIGIPLAHRLPAGAVRFAYVFALRCAGVGTYRREVGGRRAWTAAKLAWIDRYCFYRPLCEVERTLGAGRRIRHREADCARARAREHALLGRVLAWRRLDGVIGRAFRRVASAALEIE